MNKWYEEIDNKKDVVISSRIRLARNIKKYSVIKANTSLIVLLSSVFPSNLALGTYRGLIILRTLMYAPLTAMTIRDTLMPPAVEPAIAPMNITRTKLVVASIGQTS